MLHRILITVLAIWLLCPIARGQKIEDYPLPTVPDSITELEPRADYMVFHYWEKYNFQDTTLLAIPEYAEQALSNFIALLSYASPQGRQQATDQWITLATSNAKSYDFFTKEAERYLYDPESPLKNEDLLLCVLNSILASPIGNEYDKVHAQFLHQLISRNQPGTPAENFAFELPDGKRDSLSTFAPGKPLLLMFFDPECESCKHTINQLHNDTTLTQALANNQLAILTIIPNDNENKWDNSSPAKIEGVPLRAENYDAQSENWYIAISLTDIKANALYDLKTLPSLYLLDSARNVLLKDTTPDTIDSYFKK